MNINRIEDVRPPFLDAAVTVKKCGNIIEIRYMRNQAGGVIQKISAEEYIDLRTGEVKEFQHADNRYGSKASVAQSLRKLRDLINANLEHPENAKWITLTYVENMTDGKQLYEDFRRFWQRFKYYLKTNDLPIAEYITAAEPQGRGAWHMHCLFLFPQKAPYISNDEICRLWGHGFTKTKNLHGIGNPGLYLTAYLGDMELPEALNAGVKKGRLKETESVDEHGERQKKAVVKGARLKLYPPGFNIYRASRGVKRPVCWETTEDAAQAYIGDAELTYEKTFEITDVEGNTKNIINYRTYIKTKGGKH